MRAAGISESPTGIRHPALPLVVTKGLLMQVPHSCPRPSQNAIEPEKNARTGAGASSAEYVGTAVSQKPTAA